MKKLKNETFQISKICEDSFNLFGKCVNHYAVEPPADHANQMCSHRRRWTSVLEKQKMWFSLTVTSFFGSHLEVLLPVLCARHGTWAFIHHNNGVCTNDTLNWDQLTRICWAKSSFNCINRPCDTTCPRFSCRLSRWRSSSRVSVEACGSLSHSATLNASFL